MVLCRDGKWLGLLQVALQLPIGDFHALHLDLGPLNPGCPYHPL
jgi:hypothetical protein